MLDSAILLNSKKRIFKSVLGTELDVTYRPYILNILTSEYARLQEIATTAIREYVEKSATATIEDVETFQTATKNFTDCGIKIILATLKANKKEVDEEWLQENIALDEFNNLVNYIIGTIPDPVDTKKK
jgi:hypothetical protein